MEQIVDSAIYESVLAMMENMITEYDVTGYVRERSGSILPGIAPSNVYPTADGDMILIGGNGDNVFARLARVRGRPGLAGDARFRDHAARGVHQTLLDEIVSDWTRTHALEPLLVLLEPRACPVVGYSARRTCSSTRNSWPGKPSSPSTTRSSGR